MYAYIHACIHAYIHACMHTYIHAYIHAYIHTHKQRNLGMLSYMHACTHTYIHINTGTGKSARKFAPKTFDFPGRKRVTLSEDVSGS